ncbi:PREDICTED: uncharacterized protein LOC109176325 [Ipomoea nil]|uniref:uncharacterized protein LOC109176325 n=1 Tax=Ipomoea nil TaxID=35883 RepID=UPI0009013A99|nr:PREDICTED: uncharacterized protein LOC109176325 [Ipomoea nil]
MVVYIEVDLTELKVYTGIDLTGDNSGSRITLDFEHFRFSHSQCCWSHLDFLCCLYTIRFISGTFSEFVDSDGRPVAGPSSVAGDHGGAAITMDSGVTNKSEKPMREEEGNWGSSPSAAPIFPVISISTAVRRRPSVSIVPAVRRRPSISIVPAVHALHLPVHRRPVFHRRSTSPPLPIDVPASAARRPRRDASALQAQLDIAVRTPLYALQKGVELKPGKPYMHHFDGDRGRLHVSQSANGSSQKSNGSLTESIPQTNGRIRTLAGNPLYAERVTGFTMGDRSTCHFDTSNAPASTKEQACTPSKFTSIGI